MKHRTGLTSDIIESLKNYTVNLKTESTNIYDKNAVQCIAFTKNNDPIHIGYIEKKNSSLVSELINSYLSYKVKIINISNHKISCEIQFLNLTSENIKIPINKVEIKKNNLDFSKEFTKGNELYFNKDYEDAIECFLECYNHNYDPFLEILQTPPYIGRSANTRQSLAYAVMRRVGGATTQEIMDVSGINTAQRVRSMISEQIRPTLINQFGRDILLTHNQQSYQHKYGSSDGKHNLSGYEIPTHIENSNGELLYKIGYCYYSVEKKNEAFNYFLKSSNYYNADAQYMIGFMYFNGDYVKLDRKKAYSFLKLSALQGLDSAEELLDENYVSEIE